MIPPEIEQGLREAKAKHRTAVAARAAAQVAHEEAAKVYYAASTAEHQAKGAWTIAWQAYYMAHNEDIPRLMKERDKHYADAQKLSSDISKFWIEMGNQSAIVLDREDA